MGSPGFLRKKPCSMVIEQRGKSQYQMDETLVYMGQEVTFLAPSTACRYLGVWGTPTGDMSNTKERIFKRTDRRCELVAVACADTVTMLLTIRSPCSMTCRYRDHSPLGDQGRLSPSSAETHTRFRTIRSPYPKDGYMAVGSFLFL